MGTALHGWETAAEEALGCLPSLQDCDHNGGGRLTAVFDVLAACAVSSKAGTDVPWSPAGCGDA